MKTIFKILCLVFLMPHVVYAQEGTRNWDYKNLSYRYRDLGPNTYYPVYREVLGRGLAHPYEPSTQEVIYLYAHWKMFGDNIIPTWKNDVLEFRKDVNAYIDKHQEEPETSDVISLIIKFWKKHQKPSFNESSLLDPLFEEDFNRLYDLICLIGEDRTIYRFYGIEYADKTIESADRFYGSSLRGMKFNSYAEVEAQKLEESEGKERYVKPFAEFLINKKILIEGTMRDPAYLKSNLQLFLEEPISQK